MFWGHVDHERTFKLVQYQIHFKNTATKQFLTRHVPENNKTSSTYNRPCPIFFLHLRFMAAGIHTCLITPSAGLSFFQSIPGLPQHV